MKPTTRTIIKSAMEADDSVPPKAAALIMSIIDNGGEPDVDVRKPLDRILTRKQVAEIFQVSPKMVDIYGRRGYIRRISVTGKQAQGYSENSVREALERGMVNS